MIQLVSEWGAAWPSALVVGLMAMTFVVAVLLAVCGALVAGWLIREKLRERSPSSQPMLAASSFPFSYPPRPRRRPMPETVWVDTNGEVLVQSPTTAAKEYEQEELPF